MSYEEKRKSARIDSENYRREFEDTIFLGNGGCGCTAAQILKLQRKFEYALNMLGGLQQPDHPESEEHARELKHEYYKDYMKLYSAVRDIVMGLTGKEIEFIEEKSTG